MSEEKSLSWATIIPEFYFDMISRLFPGIILSIGILYSINPTVFNDLIEWSKDANDKSGPPYLIIFLLLVISSFAIGIIITPISKLLVGTYFKHIFIKSGIILTNDVKEWCLKLLKDENEAFDVKVSWEKLKREDTKVLDRLLHDSLKNADIQAKQILPKMSAESWLCSNCSSAFLFLSIFKPLFCFLKSKPFDQWWLVYLLIIFSTLCYFAAWSRSKTYLYRLFSYSRSHFENNKQK